MRRAATLAVALLLAAVPTYDVGAAAPVEARPTAVTVVNSFMYFPGDVRYPELQLQVPWRGALELVNSDYFGPHTLSSVDRDPHGRRLFQTTNSVGGDDVPAGGSATVAGVERLRPGRYRFICRIHPDVMAGELTVLSTPAWNLHLPDIPPVS